MCDTLFTWKNSTLYFYGKMAELKKNWNSFAAAPPDKTRY